VGWDRLEAIDNYYSHCERVRVVDSGLSQLKTRGNPDVIF